MEAKRHWEQRSATDQFRISFKIHCKASKYLATFHYLPVHPRHPLHCRESEQLSNISSRAWSLSYLHALSLIHDTCSPTSLEPARASPTGHPAFRYGQAAGLLIMAYIKSGWTPTLFAVCLVLLFLPGRAAAFGAGNIPSISQVEGTNWRHGGESAKAAC